MTRFPKGQPVYDTPKLSTVARSIAAAAGLAILTVVVILLVVWARGY